MLECICRSIKKVIILCIKGYRLLRPRRYPCCRFYPTCTQYTIDAFNNYNPIRATVMSVWRIIRCNPLSRGGFDPAVKDKTQK